MCVVGEGRDVFIVPLRIMEMTFIKFETILLIPMQDLRITF